MYICCIIYGLLALKLNPPTIRTGILLYWQLLSGKYFVAGEPGYINVRFVTILAFAPSPT